MARAPFSARTALDRVPRATARRWAISIASRRQATRYFGLTPDWLPVLELWRSEDGLAWQRVSGLPSIA